MLEVGSLALLVGAAALANGDMGLAGPNAYDSKRKQDINSLAQKTARDIRDAGDIYKMQGRPLQGTSAQISYQSEWYIPWGNPIQTPTHDLNKIIESRAVNTAYVASQAPKYTFASNDVLGISYGAGSKNQGYNIGCPYPGISFRGDPGNSLAHGGKVFVDRYRPSPISPWTNKYDMMAGEPTETLREELGDEADVPIKARNPYGPFGYYQQIYRNQNYEKTKSNLKKGIKPHVLQNTKYKKHWQVRFVPQPTQVYK